MLTVDYRRLGLRPGERLLDLGCGFGRHAYQAARLGAQVVAVDAAAEEVRGVAGTFGAMVEAGELDPQTVRVGAAQADALALPFPDGAFDRVVASEVLEHIPDDESAMAELARVLRPGGTMAVTVPRFGPELVNWALSDDYHDVPGGHVRIYRREQLVSRLARCGLATTGSHHAHGLHTPYWWLRCLVGPTDDRHPAVAAYHRLLVWDIERAPALTRAADRLLNPLLGKSFVLYCVKPAEAADPAAAASSPARPAPARPAAGAPSARGPSLASTARALGVLDLGSGEAEAAVEAAVPAGAGSAV
ncbi:MAG TPA: class I SAM-dependent methyltransferase, partial [Acidimicrobiales bacterium]|nr:class I SAM-dependent methyltransferase [Acidimicrobiales bacterium]